MNPPNVEATSDETRTIASLFQPHLRLQLRRKAVHSGKDSVQAATSETDRSNESVGQQAGAGKHVQ